MGYLRDVICSSDSLHPFKKSVFKICDHTYEGHPIKNEAFFIVKIHNDNSITYLPFRNVNNMFEIDQLP